MKVFRVYTDESPDGMFPHMSVKSVVVIAKDEVDAKETVKKRYKDDFSCSFDKVQTEIVCDDITQPTILSVDYFSGNY